MNTRHFLILTMLLATVFASCTEEMESEAPKEGARLTISVADAVDVGFVGGDAVTRAVYAGLNMTFEAGDQIGIYAVKGTTVIYSNILYEYNGTTWTTSEDVWFSPEYTYYAYYPYVAAPYTPDFTQSTVDDIFNLFIADASNKFWTSDQSTKANFSSANLCIAQGTPGENDNEVSFTLEHKRALAALGGGCAFATFTGNIPYRIGGTKYFLMKPSTSTSFTDDKNGTYSLSAAVGCGKIKNTPLPEVIDLSMVDCAGNPNAKGRTTANCYMVHAPGRYKLPLVFGNAIKNGEDNQIAYKPGTVTNGLDNFIVYTGVPLTAPWITKTGTGVNGGMGFTPECAEVIWQDVENLVDNYAIDGDYLTFNVYDIYEGNAVIAALNSNNYAIWSWHIWVTAETLSNTTDVNTGDHIYSVAPVNLGWVPTGGGGKQGYCTYYQWGRKDPFVPCNGTTNGNTDKTVYVGTKVLRYATSKGYEYYSNGTINNNILAPWNFYQHNTTNGPVNTTYYNMWDAQNNTTDNVATATKKTIYDPCPPGFCIPTGNLWYYFGNGSSRTMSTFDTTNKGATWNTGITGDVLWLPAAGYRGNSSGALYRVGSDGFYWSATPNSTTYGRNLYFSSSNWYWSYYYRANGFSVRPVAEE